MSETQAATKTLREYEFTFITKSDLPEGQQAEVIGGYENILMRDGGEVIKKDDWGVKKLAYPIRKNFKGHYVHYDCVSNADNIAECERLLRIDENVLRYLVIRIGENVDVEARKKQIADEMAKKQEQAAAREAAGGRDRDRSDRGGRGGRGPRPEGRRDDSRGEQRNEARGDAERSSDKSEARN